MKAISVAFLAAALAACGDQGPAPALTESPEAFPFDGPAVLTIPTYEGSGQVVHPDVAVTPPGVFGATSHLAITPYPRGDAKYENPSLFAGARPDEWTLEHGAPNPVLLPDAGYLSDPDIVYEPDARELWLYYRQVSGGNVVRLLRSSDGIRWSAPVEVARASDHDLVSQTVVRRDGGDWWMWSVKSGPAGCGAARTSVEVRRSTDGIAWSPPEPTDLTAGALWPWHIDVEWIPGRNEFWAVYNAKTSTGCTTPAVYLATSADGVAWRMLPTPVIVKGRIPEFQDIVYRTTFAYDAVTDAVTFWYSGARYSEGSYRWSAAVERRRRSDLFAEGPAAQSKVIFTPAPAPLEEWP